MLTSKTKENENGLIVLCFKWGLLSWLVVGLGNCLVFLRYVKERLIFEGVAFPKLWIKLSRIMSLGISMENVPLRGVVNYLQI